MPLMMCPNCHEGMKEISREGVQLDMCPKCGGIWLDRGELQKLLEAVRPEYAQASPPPPAAPYSAPPPQYQQPYPPQPGWHRKHDDSDDPYYKKGHYSKHYKKSKLERIFDVFDFG